MDGLRIEHIHLENVLTWKTLDLHLDGRPLALIGPNDSGKSNVLRALDFLGRIAHQPVTQALAPFGGYAAFVGHGDGERDIEIRIKGRYGSETLEYFVRLTGTHNGALSAIADESILVAGSHCRRQRDKLFSPQTGLPTAVSDPDQTMLALSLRPQSANSDHLAIWNKHTFRLQAALAATTVHRFRPDLIAQPCPPKASLALGSTGEGLAAVIERMASDPDHQDSFQRVKAKLRTLIPSLDNVGAVSAPNDPNQRLLRFKNRFEDGSGLSYNAPQASEGTLLALAYLTLAEGPDPSPFLLVEEPENGLHPSRLREVVAILRSITNKQVILTTHSPYLLDSLDPSEVRVVTRDPANGSSVLKPMAELPDLDSWRKSFSTGEIWTNALMSRGA